MGDPSHSEPRRRHPRKRVAGWRRASQSAAPSTRSPRHPAWADVPDRDWDDWRWQSQNAIRSPAARRAAPLLARGAASHRHARGGVQARHPAVLLLADRPRRPGRPDPPPVGALAAGAGRGRRLRAGRPARRGQGLAGPRPDPPLPRPGPAGHDARLHDVLPVLHAQARDHDPRRLGRRLARRRADDRVRPRPPRDPRRDRLRRRPADAAPRQARVLPREPGGDRRTSTSSASAPACRSRCRSGSTTRS